MPTQILPFFTVGYGRWPAPIRMPRLIAALQANGVTVLLDIRHSPCSSQLVAGNYGPREWHIRADGQGIADHLAATGIQYRWLPELGNPQKVDPAMEVLRQHLADTAMHWPIHRGLHRACAAVECERCCLLCACKRYDDCHRKVIAEAMAQAGGARFVHSELPP